MHGDALPVPAALTCESCDFFFSLSLSSGKCLYLSGLTPEPMTADDDYKLLSVGIGFTNMVARATKGSADLTRKEIKEGILGSLGNFFFSTAFPSVHVALSSGISGSQILLEKLQKFKPKIAVFNGKLIYEVFSGNKDFHFGRQPDFVDGTNTVSTRTPSGSVPPPVFGFICQ